MASMAVSRSPILGRLLPGLLFGRHPVDLRFFCPDLNVRVFLLLFGVEGEQIKVADDPQFD